MNGEVLNATMEVKSGTVNVATPLVSGGAAVMTMKLNFDFFDMLRRLYWQQTTKSPWTQIPTFHLSTRRAKIHADIHAADKFLL